MISSLTGAVAHVDDDALVVVVGGVGFSVAVVPQLARTVAVGSDIHLHTNLIVREDALALFGFETREELVVFGQLLSVTGVGPKSALGVLSSLTVPQIAEAVAADDDAPFKRVSGIGPKTAKLIVVQLAGKLAPPRSAAPATARAAGAIPAQVAQALIGLGWSERVAAEAVASVADGASETDRASVQALLRLTLSVLGPARREPAGG
ncbi:MULTISPECIES: Holliday junction branch migration protein RuvA [Microbacterium]|uniref:Holliday junction branch migration complex subunit RuvA n=1 Tax=Microbacterium wangchenii TaxID=2541726 RepID=A0ABX5SRL8_9MICO|nr:MULTISPECIES: Holliday junction branch migration protein RuvA [Microbacterium]MCK6065334.1 Holliday junction branch migration protein RuvA [Microbacterium sp. EYE_512]QBR88781.1 Holliday junction branch migration protein RuvA [Microbacterium wangchenii]TFV82165.1 Holliday junction branch migration protein RuvA [Microbacterium sp. dk485]TXK20505.1 Holliday junction branch migration protein RuvA [Microbacterium wangchenii]